MILYMPTRHRLKHLVARRTTFQLNDKMTLFPLYHPARTVQHTHRTLAEQKEDWAWVGRMLGSLES